LSEHLESERSAILQAALPHVPFDGWSAKTLRSAVSDAGLDPAMAQRAFPGGPRELADYLAADADRRMVEALAARNLEELPIRERIATAVRVRLELLAPHREALRLSLALRLKPGSAPHTMRAMYETVDAMWRAAGDTSTDFNFYTKRGLLAGVYVATLLYWLDDESEDFADTWAFLDRRIENIMQIQEVRGRLEKFRVRLPSLAQFRPRNPLDIARAARWASRPSSHRRRR